MKIRECPCHKDGNDCLVRHSICHETCPDYKEWREEKDADNEAKRDKNQEQYLGYVCSRIIERKKRKNEKNRT